MLSFSLPIQNFFQILWKRFFIPSLYILEKNSFLTNIRNECVFRKMNLYFLTSLNSKTFPSNSYHFQYNHRLLFSREIRKIRTCKKIRMQKLIKFRLSGEYSFWDFSSFLWHFSSFLKMKNHMKKVSPFHSLQNVLIETSNVCFKSF